MPSTNSPMPGASGAAAELRSTQENVHAHCRSRLNAARPVAPLNLSVTGHLSGITPIDAVIALVALATFSLLALFFWVLA